MGKLKKRRRRVGEQGGGREGGEGRNFFTVMNTVAMRKYEDTVSCFDAHNIEPQLSNSNFHCLFFTATTTAIFQFPNCISNPVHEISRLLPLSI